MYAPKLFSDDLFTFLSENVDSTSKFDERVYIKDQGINYQEDQKQDARNLFAPPLLAYSPERPGASIKQLEYTIQSGFNFNMQPITPLIQRKSDQLQQIRNYGYRTIRPLGVGKTMEQLSNEEGKRYNINDGNEELSFVPTAENTSGMTPDSSINEQHSMRHGELVNPSNNDSIVDLDAQIPSADADSEGVDDFETDPTEPEINDADLDDLVDEDEGFMAEEVEYQDDHSLNTETNYSSYANNNTSNVTSGNFALSNSRRITSHSFGAAPASPNIEANEGIRVTIPLSSFENDQSFNNTRLESESYENENMNVDMVVDN